MPTESVFPCAGFFRKRQFVAGSVAFLMQLSVVLWPWATNWARVAGERRAVEALLAELSGHFSRQGDGFGVTADRIGQVA